MPDIFSYLRSFRHLTRLPDGDGELLQRFRMQRDELAFATLVQRHGPMVLGIVQRILEQNDLHDDVFQATFLVLARRGRHLETWPSVAGWLVQVARRTALQARAKAARRTRHEQQAATMTPASKTTAPLDDAGQRELAEQIDAELARLPSKYRTPLVLCHLEGQTKEETARQLGWPVGSVSGRLARGKKLLQDRLLRRGIVPTLAVGAFVLPAARAHLPSLLLQATTLLATNVVHQTSKVSAGTAVVLAQGVMTSMLMTKVKYAAAIMLILGLCLGTGAWAWPGQGEQKTAQGQALRIEAKRESLLKRIQGLWVLEQKTIAGEQIEEMNRLFLRFWRFNNDSMETLVNQGGFSKRWPMKLNESVDPVTIQLGEFNGIIQLDDNKLLVDVKLPQSTKEKPLACSVVLHRADDYARLEGVWRKEERNPANGRLINVDEIIFVENKYVRRTYGTKEGRARLALLQDLHPEKFELHSTQTPAGIDFDIRDESYLRKHSPAIFSDKGKLSKLRLNERQLGIFQLSAKEFKYVITGSIPLVLEGDHLVPDLKSPAATRASSFEKTDRPIQVYQRHHISLKDEIEQNLIPNPLPPDKDEKTESLLQELQGAWVVETSNATSQDAINNAALTRGTHSYLSNLSNFRYWKFKGDKVYISDNWVQLSEQPSIFMPVQIDTRTTPARISVAGLVGTIELKAGKLQVCFVPFGSVQGIGIVAKDASKDQLQKMVEFIKSRQSFQDSWTVSLRRATDYDLLKGIWRKEQRNPVTEELMYVEELIFRNNYYVRRSYSPAFLTNGKRGPVVFQHETQPEQFELHEALRPKGIDLDIKNDEYVKQQLAMRPNSKLNRDDLLPERRLGIYELTDSEFKFVISSAVLFEMNNGRYQANHQAPGVRRDSSFEKATNKVEVYQRCLTSRKDTSDPGKSHDALPSGGDANLTAPNNTKPTGNEPSSRVLELRQQRFKLAQERMKLWQEAYKAGRANIADLDNISQQYHDAGVALSKNAKDTLRIKEELRDTLQDLEKIVESQYKAATVTYATLVAIQLRRIELEIQIEELKELENTMKSNKK